MRFRSVFFAAAAAFTVGLGQTLVGSPLAATAAADPSGGLSATISSPANGWTGARPLAVQGTALDDSRVIRVEMQVFRESDRTFWNGATSSWSPDYPPYGQRPTSTIFLGQNTTSASWNYTLNAPDVSGRIWFSAIAFDDAGNFAVSPAQFADLNGQSPTTVPAPTTIAPVTTAAPAPTTIAPATTTVTVTPTTSAPVTTAATVPTTAAPTTLAPPPVSGSPGILATITSPPNNYAGAKPFIISGNAADDSKVVRVELQIYRTADGTFWNGGTSSWSTAYPSYGQRPVATIVSGLNTPSALWTFSFNPPESIGAYSVSAIGFDDSYGFAVSPSREYRIDASASPTPTSAPTTAPPTTTPPATTTAAPTTAAPTTAAPTTAAPPAPTTAATTAAPSTTAAPTPSTVYLAPGVLAVAIAAPGDGWSGPKPLTIQGSAADDSRVVRVEMQVYRPSDGTYLNGSTSAWSTNYPPYGQRPVATIVSGLNTRSASWTYALNPSEASGTYSVTAIVFDDANGFAVSAARGYTINGSGPTATPGSRLPEQLYASNAAPAEQVGPGSALLNAQRVNVSCSGIVRGMSWYRTAADTGTITGVVWRNNVEVARSTGTATSTGWNHLDFVIPLTVSAGEQLVVGVHHPSGGYGRTLGGLTGRSITSPSGCLTIPASTSGARNGLVSVGSVPALPFASDGDSEYFIAPDFEQSTAAITTTTTTTSPTTTTPPQPTVLADPMNQNPSVSGTGGWGFSGATYDASQSRTTGSGSFKFTARNQSAISSVVAVTPGQPYTLSAFIKTAAWPSGNVSLFPLEMDAGGGFVRFMGESLTIGAPGQPNSWQEVATVIVPTGSTRYIALGANRADEQFVGSGDMWMDDLTITPGVQTRAPNPNRTAFNGAQTRVDALGNWEVLENGQWKAWFPFCIAANINRTNYQVLANQGFNCDIWSGFEAFGAEKAKSAGMRSFFQLAQYTQPGGWSYRDFAQLSNKIREINASPAGDYVAGYWWDNEAPWGQFTDYEQVMRTVQNEDRLNGVRRRPIVQLLNSTYSRAFANNGSDFSDVLAGYTPGGGGSGPGSYTGNRLLNQTIGSQSQPSSLCQVAVAGRNFRTQLFGCIAHGGRAASYWMDGTGANIGGFSPLPVDQQDFWPSIPAIRQELDAMMPVIRAAESTTWKISSSSGHRVWPLAYSTREVNGVANMILVNMTSSPISTTMRVDSGSYQVGEIRDYFTNQLVAVASNGSFSLTVAGSDLNSGTRVLKLLPR